MKSLHNVPIEISMLMMMIMIIFQKFTTGITTDEKKFYYDFGIHKNNDDYGYDQFGKKTWLPSFDLMKDYYFVECGKDLYDQTDSFVAIMNRIYQFHSTEKELFVTIYYQARERYSSNDKQLNIYGGYQTYLFNIVPHANELGRFRKRRKDIFYCLPDEVKKRLQISLIWHKYRGFNILIRLLLCCNRYWLVLELPSELNGYSITPEPITYFNYHSLRPKQDYHLISISYGDRVYNIVYEIGSYQIRMLDFNLTKHSASLCFGKDSTRSLQRIRSTEECQYNDRFDTMTHSLINFFQIFTYGFTIFSDLILVSREKDLILIVDQNLFATFNQEFIFKTRNARDFFTCNHLPSCNQSNEL
uniref:Uncharacterized protein LOC113791367 n=1 Tax=Dermatophagoides pteronyssinus TaxID=6956 RepID=A0A6P6XU31_DERPT|nr:uncharacterized protein LOC113791367 [Dermatophagoides pteronyssinus]